MRRKNRSLLLLLLILGIGFAVIGTTLYINGNTIISSNSEDFDVKFTKAIRGEEDISSTAISSNGKTITYTTDDLSEKDDESILKYTVKNNSSLYDASVSVNCTSGEHSEYYSVTNSLDSLIEAKTSKDGTITVKLLKNSEEEISEEFTCTLTATAEERTSKGTAVTEIVDTGNFIRMTPSEDILNIDLEKTGMSDYDGTVDVVSHNISTDLVTFYGVNGYANYIGYLNEIAKMIIIRLVLEM